MDTILFIPTPQKPPPLPAKRRKWIIITGTAMASCLLFVMAASRLLMMYERKQWGYPFDNTASQRPTNVATKSEVTGAFGWTIGQKLSVPEYGLTFTNDQGSISYHYPTDVKQVGFDSITVEATKDGIIYSIDAIGNDHDDYYDQKRILLKALDDKYGVLTPGHTSPFGMTYEFGNTARMVKLQTDDKGSFLEVVYEDVKTARLMLDQWVKARDQKLQSITNAL